ncbi:hypothetical protein KIN20_020350 [Parelaphostrongylus tenuis]|uniref:Uncharacterized protein n=1 Tax=Parelaphostrongylus tenuis TaxID=148309 RepID=A0AAD5MSR7_PARTN|nr:hypothetical protein KIN20_020350 [Parelaphostrongylus tenuis]
MGTIVPCGGMDRCFGKHRAESSTQYANTTECLRGSNWSPQRVSPNRLLAATLPASEEGKTTPFTDGTILGWRAVRRLRTEAAGACSKANVMKNSHFLGTISTCYDYPETDVDDHLLILLGDCD